MRRLQGRVAHQPAAPGALCGRTARRQGPQPAALAISAVHSPVPHGHGSPGASPSAMPLPSLRRQHSPGHRRIWPRPPEGLVIMTIRSTPPLVKTETAADYVQQHARNPLTRAHAADAQQAIAVCRAADNPVDAAAALTGLLAAVAECAGSSWLKANTDDPDVARLTALLGSAAERAPACGFPDAGDLDDVLAAVLWAAHGPQ